MLWIYPSYFSTISIVYFTALCWLCTSFSTEVIMPLCMLNILLEIKDKKVKVTLVQALRLCTGRTAHRGSRGIALPFHDHNTRRGWGASVTPQPLFTHGKDPVSIVQESGWAPRMVWTGAENLAPTGIQSPDRPAHSQSLFQLRYRAHTTIWSP